ncbi:hypothetical protein [Teichococcus deserti]|uniref:hypothetical protein n=1 Tax=Teichococcus deserti TaxID=1817963 RepID=UPI0013F66124|nr:hypothetical protein [Pseudoroseomonas deserti]
MSDDSGVKAMAEAAGLTRLWQEQPELLRQAARKAAQLRASLARPLPPELEPEPARGPR